MTGEAGGLGQAGQTTELEQTEPAGDAGKLGDAGELGDAGKLGDAGELAIAGGSADPDELLSQFLDYAAAKSLELYPHQEEAFLEILDGHHVIVSTPTGTGKSLIATAAHFAALSQNKRSFYTAPTKALVSEKFLALRQDFGADQVGLITGDASINPQAPIIACTAEILAYLALREGAECEAEMVIMDEFHYYGDPERGWAWQTPLVQLPRAQFVLMSATLGDMSFFEADLAKRTGRECVLITGAERPVPLRFRYCETPLHETITELLEADLAPVYVVHFTQREAFAAAQSMASLNVLSAQERSRARDIIADFPFDTPVGKDLRRLVGLGIGVHHGGLLPKYRLLMEQLASQDVLKLISGTDTLGVGINVPIRTVLLTQLCRFDGAKTRIVTAREFHQIAGRAGRQGFDTEGHVWVQAPAHWIENQQAERKAAAKVAGGTDGKPGRKPKKIVKKKPPEHNYAHWSDDTYKKLVAAEPEPLGSHFAMNHHILLSTLGRPDDNCAAVVQLLRDNHEPRARQRRHIRQAVALYRSLKQANLVHEQVADEIEGFGSGGVSGASDKGGGARAKPRKVVQVSPELQDNFALLQPLSLFALEALWVLEPETHGEVLSVIEAVLENPTAILRAQEQLSKKAAMEEFKAQGLDYDQRLAKLEEITYPKPLEEFLLPAFEVFARQHPWVGSHQPEPKSIAREMFETQLGFADYIRRYDLKRSEGLLLRYLVDVYRSLRQNIPADLEASLEDNSIAALRDWLFELIQSVDSNVLDDLATLSLTPALPATTQPEAAASQPDWTAIGRLVRREMFGWVEALARRDYQIIPEPLGPAGAEQAMAAYWEQHDELAIDADARSTQFFEASVVAGATSEPAMLARQVLCDPQGWHEWQIQAEVYLTQPTDNDSPATSRPKLACVTIAIHD